MTDDEIMIIRERLVRLETKMNVLAFFGGATFSATLSLIVLLVVKGP